MLDGRKEGVEKPMIVYLVNKKLGLSPGFYTKRQSILKDLQRKKQKALEVTQMFKRRRRERKAKRYQHLSTRETREGTSYSAGCDLVESTSQDIQEIPAPAVVPQYEPIESKQLAQADEIYFDLETTGLARDSHIVQMAAVRDGGVFSQYVVPKRPMSPKASEITGITVKFNQVYHHHKKVDAVGITVALQNFLEFLKEKDMNVRILIGHNCKIFDLPVLLNTLKNLNMLQSFLSLVTGFIDTLPLFKISHPGFSSYSQLHIFESILHEEYSAHDAVQDVIALKRLVNQTNPSTEVRAKVSCTLSSAVELFHHKEQAKCLLATLKDLTEGKVISNGMANKIANSGLSLSHLLIAFRRNGREGIRDVFSEKLDGHVRVTKSNKIIDAVSDFFSSEP